MATFKDQYRSVMGKREWMLSTGAVSAPDEPGTKVAILSPFLPGQAYDERDGFEFYERQEAALVDYFRENDREPITYMRATLEDLQAVLGDTAIPTVVVTGWGNFSSLALPYTKDKDEERFFSPNWQQMASMATHVKTGRAVMMQCLRYHDENFNPPLFLGIVTSHAHILGNQGEPSFAANTTNPVTLPGPITNAENLTYADIKNAYNNQLERQKHVPLLPDRAIPDDMYKAARRIRNVVRDHIGHAGGLEDDSSDRKPEPLPPPDLSDYKQYFSQIQFA